MRKNFEEITVCCRTRKSMYWVFVWPKTDEELNPGKSYYIRFLFFLVTTSTVTFSVLMHPILTLKEHLDRPTTESFAVSISLCGIYYIILSFAYRRADITSLFKDLSNFEHFGIPPGFKKEEKFLTLVSNCLFIYSLVGTTIYTLIRYSKKSECEIFAKEKKFNENCGFIAPIWTPFDTHKPFIFYTVFFYFFLIGQLLLKPSLLISSCLYEITRHVVLRIKHLNSMILHCFESEDYCTTRKKLKRCIIYHNNILDLAARLDFCYSNTMLLHLTLTSTVIACLEKQFIEDEKISAAVHFFGWVVALLIPCLAGQLLLDAAESISETVWFSKWYTCDVRLRKHVQLLLERSQKDLHISVGPFGTLSYSLFVSVVKMSYSVLCFLSCD